MSGNKTRVFVYGTLKQGHYNHEYYLADATFLGRCDIAGDFRMYSNGAFPMVTRGSDPTRVARIVGECYEVDEATLANLDMLEGHPDWYCREKVETPFKKAWVYLMPEEGRYSPEGLVESGVFYPSEEELEWINGRQAV